jgi:hypothetical protein
MICISPIYIPGRVWRDLEARKGEGRNLRVWQHPEQGVTLPVGGVLQSIVRSLLIINLSWLLVDFGGLDLFSDSPWEAFILYCLLLYRLTNHFDIIGDFFQSYRSLVYEISLLSK